MRRTTIRFALALSVIMSLAITAPADSAEPTGTVRLIRPTAHSLLGDEAVIQWTYTTGRWVSTTSKLVIAVSPNNWNWTILSSKVPIKSAYVWDTTGFPSGKYYVKAWLTTVVPLRAFLSPLVIDRDAPVVSIAEPTEGSVGGFATTNAGETIVTGRTKLVANATDALSGISTVKWYLEDDLIAEGADATYNFDQNYGKHQLIAKATDRAGNEATTEIWVTAVPGPISPLENLGVLPTEPVDETPSPDPSPSETPTPEPSPSSSPALPITIPGVPAP